MRFRTVTIALVLAAGSLAAACGGPTTGTSGSTDTAPIDATTATTATGAAPTTTTAPAAAPRPTGLVDDLFAVDDGRLHLRCAGAGDVTVVLVAGWDDPGDKWGAIEPALTERARVCSYSRFGTGASDAPTSVQTFSTQAAALGDLLETAGEPGPYVVVGQSFGGAAAVTFASQRPDDVAGLMLIDASPPSWPDVVCSVPAWAPACAVMHDPALDAERLDVFPAFAAVGEIASLGDVPMTIVTAAHRTDPALAPEELDRLDVAWDAGVAQWAALSSSSTVISVEDTGHHIEVDQPQLVIAQANDLLSRVNGSAS